MAAEHQNANPIIVEPADSSHPRTPPRVLTPSLNTSSSSSSFDSSRPHSRAGSAASPSESPLPTPGDVELTHIRPPDTPDAEPLPPMNPFVADERARNMTDSTRTRPLQRAEGSWQSIGSAWVSSYRPMFSRRRWLEQFLAVVGLVASLFGLLFIGVRTYKLAVISTENSTLDGCTGLIQVSDVNASLSVVLTSSQAGVTSFENSTQLCKLVMKTGPLSSPYHLGKRILHSSLALTSRWMKRPSKQTCGFLYVECRPKWANVTSLIVSTTVALGGLILLIARRNASSTEIFTSPACSDIHITHHEDTGPRTVTGQGILEKHNSEDHDHDLGEIHKRIRASHGQDSLMKDTAPSQSTDSSATTLVDGGNKSKVSLEDGSSGVKHEGLFGFQMNGRTKVFFKFETGEFFHLKHWKPKNKEHSDPSRHEDHALIVKGDGFA